MSDPTNDREGISSDTLVPPVIDSSPEVEYNTHHQENSKNDGDCHENIDNNHCKDHTVVVFDPKKYNEEKFLERFEELIAEELGCDEDERKSLVWKVKVEVGKKIYKGKPPMPQEEYLGKWKSGNAVKWFVEKYSDVLSYSDKKPKLADFRRDNPKLFGAMKKTFILHPEEIRDLFEKRVFEKIGIFTEPKVMSELFGKSPKKTTSHVQSLLEEDSGKSGHSRYED